MKNLRNHAVYFLFLLSLFVIAKEKLFVTFVFVVCILWYQRCRDYSIVFLLIAMGITCIPRFIQQVPVCSEAKVISVSSSYAVLYKDHTKFILYTDEPLILDGDYTFETEFRKVQSSSSFFGFSFETYCKRNGIYYCGNAKTISLQKENRSIRRFLQKYIDERGSEQERKILYKTVLNVNDASNEEDWLAESGFSYSGILILASLVFSRFLDKKKTKKMLLLLEAILLFIYRFPLTVMMHLANDILFFTDLDSYDRTAFALILILLWQPSAIYSFAFQIIACMRLCSLFAKKNRFPSLSILLILESLNYNRMNPVRTFTFRLSVMYSGLLWFYGILAVIFRFHYANLILFPGECLSSFTDIFNMPGSIKGAGFLFFVALAATFRKNEKYFKKVYFTLLLFQLTGLFHPFMELSIINVGQGDAIYLKGPLHTADILVDTGKPQSYSALETFLNAKGVNKLDALIITHNDNDHSGNKELLIQNYDVKKTIETHEEKTELWPFVLYDLNTITNDNENQSSIMNYFAMNGLKVMLCGDGDETSEKEILKKYGNLKVDVLKAGHHGSATSSSSAFLDTIQPEIALFSAGSPSLYHHPSSAVIHRMEERHISYLNTYEEGDITIISLPFCNLMISANGYFTILH